MSPTGYGTGVAPTKESTEDIWDKAGIDTGIRRSIHAIIGDMKLWLLIPKVKGYRKIGRIYDDAIAIVRAETETAARNIAQHSTAISPELVDISIWKNPELSMCKELSPDGDAEIICEMTCPVSD